MRVIVRAFGVSAVVAVLSSSGVQAQDPLAQLGLTEPAARDLATSMAVGRMVPGWVDPSIKALFKAMPSGVRATATRATWAWARRYLSSPEFREVYEKERVAARPVARRFDGTVDDELNKMRDEQVKAIEEVRRTVLPTLPADQRSAMETQLREQEEMVKGAEFRQLMRTGIEQLRQAARAEYERRLQLWEEDLPANPQALISKRLREFLAVCADVDFSAQTALVDGKQRFVNPVYEAKPAEWKECYRAGREPHEAAREAATAWIRETGSRE